MVQTREKYAEEPQKCLRRTSRLSEDVCPEDVKILDH